jgi:hypothetical protein
MTVVLAKAERGPTEAAAPKPPAVIWEATALPREVLAGRARLLQVGSQHPDKRAQRAMGTDRLLSWLETFPGSAWQERWNTCEAEGALATWHQAPALFICATAAWPVSEVVARRVAVVGLNALLYLAVIRPSYRFLFASRLKDTYAHIRALTDPGFFPEAFAICERAGHRERHQLDAMHHLCRIVVHTGRGPRELTPEDLLSYHAAVVEIGQANSLALSWDLLRETGVFPAGTPTLRAARHRGSVRSRNRRSLAHWAQLAGSGRE